MVRVDPRNPTALAMAERLASRLDLDALPEELCLVVGGDGWMLSVIGEGDPDTTYLGLNAGHLGFLLNDVRGSTGLETTAAALAEGRWRVLQLPRLQLQATAPDQSVTTALAVNDVYVERSSGNTTHLRLRIDGKPVVDQMSCDGLIVATALGSTAYSFSAGGVPCHPLVRAVHVTPICPHTPRLSPFTLPEGVRIDVEVLDGELRPARAASDGVNHGPVSRLQVEMAHADVKLAFLDGHDLTGTLIRKILRA